MLNETNLNDLTVDQLKALANEIYLLNLTYSTKAQLVSDILTALGSAE